MRVLWACLPLFVAIAAAPPPSSAQAPSCGAESDGALACQEGRLCRCGLARGSAMRGTAEGWRWDCGLLRPACPGARNIDPTIDPYRGPLPQALQLDQSRTTIVEPPAEPPRFHVPHAGPYGFGRDVERW